MSDKNTRQERVWTDRRSARRVPTQDGQAKQKKKAPQATFFPMNEGGIGMRPEITLSCHRQPVMSRPSKGE